MKVFSTELIKNCLYHGWFISVYFKGFFSTNNVHDGLAHMHLFHFAYVHRALQVATVYNFVLLRFIVGFKCFSNFFVTFFLSKDLDEKSSKFGRLSLTNCII